MDRELKYLIIGAGGTGGAIGSHLVRAGKDVTFIARGKHLYTMVKQGLKVVKPSGDFIVTDFQASDMEHYSGDADVIFVCVKGYALEEIIPFLQKIAKRDTVVIPVLNIYGTGGEIQKKLSDSLVLDGCIYVAAEIKEPGVIFMNGDILRVIFGVRNKEDYRSVLNKIENDLNESGIKGILSDNIKRDTMVKFSYISAQNACGTYYNVAAGEIQKPGEIRDCFASLVHEIKILGEAMNIKFEEDLVERNLRLIDSLSSNMTTSMQRDIRDGNKSEIKGLVYSVVNMAEHYGVDLPVFKKITNELKKRE